MESEIFQAVLKYHSYMRVLFPDAMIILYEFLPLEPLPDIFSYMLYLSRTLSPLAFVNHFQKKRLIKKKVVKPEQAERSEKTLIELILVLNCI